MGGVDSKKPRHDRQLIGEGGHAGKGNLGCVRSAERQCSLRQRSNPQPMMETEMTGRHDVGDVQIYHMKEDMREWRVHRLSSNPYLEGRGESSRGHRCRMGRDDNDGDDGMGHTTLVLMPLRWGGFCKKSNNLKHAIQINECNNGGFDHHGCMPTTMRWTQRITLLK
ncbi:hypothetical protein ACLOJK_040675 [Asimina triloba]